MNRFRLGNQPCESFLVASESDRIMSPPSVSRTPMRKVLGILTEDFRLYHDLVAALKARDVPFASLSFARRIPDTVGVVLTSPAEAHRIRRGRVVPVDDIDSSIGQALQLLRGKSEWEELRIGVDPGREPGVAIIGDGEVIDTRIAASPEAVAFHVRQAIRTFPAKDVRVRIGHGDPTNRDRVLNALSRDGLRVEIVDEAGATPRSPPPRRDAADDIAPAPRPRGRPPVRDPTDARRGPRDPAPIPPRQRWCRHDFLRARWGGGTRGPFPRRRHRPRSTEGATVKGLGCNEPRVPFGA